MQRAVSLSVPPLFEDTYLCSFCKIPFSDKAARVMLGDEDTRGAIQHVHRGSATSKTCDVTNSA
jgi:hypothetical protein